MSEEHEIFHDISPYGERNWQFYKIMNLQLAEYADKFNHKLAEKIRNCSTYLELKRSQDTGYLRLSRCYYCKDKLCYLCSWRRSLKSFHQLKNVLNKAYELEVGCRFIFLTLTAKSSLGEDLNLNIKKMNRSVSKLLQYKKIKKFLVGYVRSTEVTVNDGINNSDLRYHHHVHVILMVKDYFNDSNYISQSYWVNLWKKALNVSYSPILNVKAIKPRKNMTAIESVSLELSKYIVKPSSYLSSVNESDKFKSEYDSDTHNVNVIKCLHSQLYGLRRTSYGGVLKKVRSELYGSKSSDLESDNDLTHISDSKINDSKEDDDIVKVFWNDISENYYRI